MGLLVIGAIKVSKSGHPRRVLLRFVRRPHTKEDSDSSARVHCLVFGFRFWLDKVLGVRKATALGNWPGTLQMPVPF